MEEENEPPPGWQLNSHMFIFKEEQIEEEDGPPPGCQSIPVKQEDVHLVEIDEEEEEDDDDDGPPPDRQSVPRQPQPPPTFPPAISSGVKPLGKKQGSRRTPISRKGNTATGSASRKRRLKSSKGKSSTNLTKTKPMKQKKSREVEVRPTAYRSSLGGIMNLIKELKLRECHKEVLKRTPFWRLFNAIIQGRLTPNQCRKSDKLIVKIIEAYDHATRKFRLGGKYVGLTRNDIGNIFGICSGKEAVGLKYGSRDEVNMVARRKLHHKRLTTPTMKKLLETYVLGNNTDDIKDVARLLCLYVCHTLFFPHSTTVKWVYLERIENLEKLMEYDWCGAIANDLMTSIRKNHQQPKKVSGCVVALLYWLCDHTNVVEAFHTDENLGFIRWSIPTMLSKFRTMSLEDLRDDQVDPYIQDARNGDASDNECTESVPGCGGENDVALSLIRLGEEVLPCSDSHKEVVPCSDSHKEVVPCSDSHKEVLPCSDSHKEVLPCSDSHKEVLPCSDSHGWVYDCDDSSESDACYYANNRMSGKDADATKIRKDVECHRIDNNKLIESVGRSENVDNSAREDEENTSLIRELRLQVSKRDEEIEELVRKGKQREVQHAVAIEVKDEEIADLNKSISYLLDENDQLSAELDEIHNITQRHISNSQNVSPRIWMKRLRRKSRRGTEDLQFAYKTKKQKLTSEDENEEGPSDKDVINVDNIPPGPVSLPYKPVPIKNLRSYGVHCLLSTEDQQRISQIWSEAYSSTCIWSGSEMGSSIYVDDIRQLIVNSSISGSVIDAYSEILMRDQSKMVGELQSDGTQMTNETSYVFTCGLLSTIIPKSREERLRLLDKWMPRGSAFRYLHFPILHAYHWTLLVLDNEEGSWKFYNSKQSRTGVDRSCEAATQLKRQVESYWKSKTKGLFMTHECKPIQLMEDSPQQGHSTLDCGVVVCYVIRQYFRNEPISSQLPEGGCQKMRSDILHAFLSDENNSWSLERQMNEDDEMKCTNSCIQ